ncbi:putative Sensor histidine kinase [Nitrospira sp. KM1]|uniref:sensor histidine kinase n=1 Tax=Nitrospira sp. KM1 TaxID=1936990 RepID=UPI0013A74490|nr:sensor histidine kinase [Nitrospira sp. KM1]BCA55381.1 putative Sensor histidine kinase [Nitrospira sp. KM1]
MVADSGAETPATASWFSGWSIEQRILAGFGLVFAGIMVITAISYRNTAEVLQNSRMDTASHELIRLLTSISETLDAAENGHRRFLVTGDESYLKAHRTVKDQAPEYFRYLEFLTAGSAEQQTRISTLEQLIGKQIDSEEQAIRQRAAGGAEGVRHLALSGAAKVELVEIHRVVAELDTAEQQSMRTRILQSTVNTRNTIALLGLGALLLLVLLAAVYYLIHHDITARRRVAAELQRRGEQLQAANKELEAFSYSVSHDLRAPLRHIDGYASLLSKAAGPSLNEKAQRYLQTISDSAKQMGQLIDDLLVFSRMGRQEMLRTTVNLNQLVKSVIHDLRLDLQAKTISWTIGSLPDVPGDPAMLRQVYANLLSNAVKFTATRETPKIEIGAVAAAAPGEIELFVKDNGVGFDMQYVNKLFGVFQRLHRNDEFEGTGIGLANVRRIVHRHGGKTWAEGAIDQGATFRFSLPLNRNTQ